MERYDSEVSKLHYIDRLFVNNSDFLLRQQCTGNKVLYTGGKDVRKLIGRQQAHL